jgi:hypothetical protein
MGVILILAPDFTREVLPELQYRQEISHGNSKTNVDGDGSFGRRRALASSPMEFHANNGYWAVCRNSSSKG